MGSNKSTNGQNGQHSSSNGQNAQKSSTDQNTSKAQVKIVIRRCLKCGVFDTPLWRTGPAGPKTLCNACGLRYKKEANQVDTTLALGSLNDKMPGTPRTTNN